mgnify:CR=1 FL=1
MSLGERLAALNAVLNATSGVLLYAGLRAIKTGRRRLHWQCMTAAFAVSAIFLASYLTRVYVSGTHRFPGSGALKIAYYAILFSHMLLAATVPFLAVRTIWLSAKKKDFPRHVRIARITWPVWMYVSVTGVIVYVMLYHLA